MLSRAEHGKYFTNPGFVKCKRVERKKDDPISKPKETPLLDHTGPVKQKNSGGL